MGPPPCSWGPDPPVPTLDQSLTFFTLKLGCAGDKVRSCPMNTAHRYQVLMQVLTREQVQGHRLERGTGLGRPIRGSGCGK